jgi:hypothetical protein
MALTIDDVLAWDPEALDRTADKLNQHQKTLLALQDELTAGEPPGSWQHAAAERARRRHWDLDERILDVAAEVRAVAVTIDVVAPALRRARNEILGQLQHARDHGFTVDHKTLTVRPPADPADEGTAAAHRTKAREIADELARALHTAQEVDSDVANALSTAAAGRVDGGSGTLAEAMAQLPHLEGSYAEALKVARDQAATDAAIIADALERGLEADELEAGTRLLDQINERLTSGEKLSASEAAYVETWLNAIGADDLASLPDRLTEDQLGPIADAILNYSNPQLHQADSGVVVHTPPSVVPPRTFIPLTSMPEAIQELATLRPGHETDSGLLVGVEPDTQTLTRRDGGSWGLDKIDQGEFDDVRNYDKLAGWARLLDSASEGVQGGDTFSRSLAEQAIQAKQDLNAIAETAESRPEEYTPPSRNGYLDRAELDEGRFNDDDLSRLLSVAARNEDGSADLLLDVQSRRSLLTLNWDNTAGAQDLVAAATDRGPEHGSGDPGRQAEAALVVMSDVAQDPARWHDLTAAPMTDAIVDVGIRWRDTFGGDSVSVNDVQLNGADPLDRPVGPKVQMVNEDLRGYLSFVAGAENEAAGRFHASLIDYGDGLVRSALAGEESVDLRNALTWAGHADGRMTEAYIDQALDPDEEQNDRKVAEIIAKNREIAANKVSASVGTSLAGSGSAAVPGAGPFLSAGINGFSRPMLDEIFALQDVPDYTEVEREDREAQLKDAREWASSARDHRFAGLVASQHADSPDYADLFDSEGQLRELDEIRTDGGDLADLRGLADTMLDDWNSIHPTEVDMDKEYDDRRDGHVEGAGADADREDKGLRDDDAARRHLYGDYDLRTREPGSRGVGGLTRSVLDMAHEKIGTA